MSVKVEMEVNEEKKMVALSFQCNSETDHEILDAIRVAMFGDFEKRGGYVSSNQLVVQVKTE
jgi:hypothetical protein